MTPPNEDVILEWQRVVAAMDYALKGVPDVALDLRAESDGWSIREYVHHIVESNLVASNIVLAALARSGAVYDWSWVMPNTAWVQRMGYRKVPLQSGLVMLRALTQFIGDVITASAGGLTNEVQLMDRPGAELYTRTVRQVLEQEISHAAEHLKEVAHMRSVLNV